MAVTYVKRTFRQRAIIDKLTRISAGGHGQPVLVDTGKDNGKIEKIADHLLRGAHTSAP